MSQHHAVSSVHLNLNQHFVVLEACLIHVISAESASRWRVPLRPNQRERELERARARASESDIELAVGELLPA